MQLQTSAQYRWPKADFSSVARCASRLDVTWSDGQTRSIPLVWLRDNCLCSQCRIVSTGEHRYFLGGVDEIPDATAIALAGGRVSIAWTDGHVSQFDPGDLAMLDDVASRHHPAAELWADDYTPARFDHDAIMGDAEVRLAFLRTAMRDGMAVVTDVPTESGECARFLERLRIPVRDTPFDRVHDVYFHADGYNVAHTDEPLPPHNDFASYAWPPSGQLLHMLINEVEGGEWVNVDGFKVLAELSQTHPAAVDTLARVQVAFREHSDTAESWTRAPIVRRDSRGDIVGIRFSNQLMQPLDPSDPDVEDFYRAYHLLARAVCLPENQIVFRGDAGTMQFVHGHRILHARRGFDGTSGSRHLQDTYFDFDDVASLVAMMSGDAR